MFLCHHRLKSPNAIRSIHQLQSFLKRDDDRYVGLGRDIAWDILGICHQQSGNLVQALSAYEESLKQTNKSSITIAVEKRIKQTVDDMLLRHTLIWGSGSRPALVMLKYDIQSIFTFKKAFAPSLANTIFHSPTPPLGNKL